MNRDKHVVWYYDLHVLFTLLFVYLTYFLTKGVKRCISNKSFLKVCVFTIQNHQTGQSSDWTFSSVYLNPLCEEVLLALKKLVNTIQHASRIYICLFQLHRYQIISSLIAKMDLNKHNGNPITKKKRRG